MFTKRTTKAGVVRIVDGIAVLDSHSGSYVLRRVGPDSRKLEEVFKRLEGRRLLFSGRPVRQYFFASSWTEVIMETIC